MNLTLRKVESESYTAKSHKTYEAYKGGQHVGYVAQTLCFDWQVSDRYHVPVSKHTTIRAAARVEGRAL